MKKVFAVLFTVSLLMASDLMFAHHSDGSDKQVTITLTGTVTKFEFINPHVLIRFDAKDDKGKIEPWTVVFGSPNSLRSDKRTGPLWNRNTLKPGDQITITAHPYKDGRKFLGASEKIVANGVEILVGESHTLTEYRLKKEAEAGP